MKRLSGILMFIFLLFFIFCGCTAQKEVGSDTSFAAESTAEAQEKKLSVVCSIFPQYDFCREIMGKDGNIELLLKTKVDMHNYKPSAEDILKIKNCDLFINIGGESDEWANDVVSSAENEKLSVLSLIDIVEAKEEETLEGMEEEEHAHDEDEEEHEHEKDEHIWTSLKNAEKIVRAISERLCSLDKANAEKYRKNAEAYIEKLSELERQYAETVNNAKRSTLVFADRFPFRYLADDYSLECFAAFSGCSAETQASFETIAFLSEKVKEKDIPYVLIIDGSDGSVAETVASQSGAEIKTLDSCQSVSEDEIKNGKSYLSIMRKNLDVLKEVLN